MPAPGFAKLGYSGQSWYYYVDQKPVDEGDVNRIVTQDHTQGGGGGPDHYTAVRFEYDGAQRVSFMLGEAWDADGPDEDSCPDNYVVTWAREFRYDAPRARYLNRELDPAQFRLGVFVPVENGDTWSDYDGDEIHGDFSVTGGPPPSATNLRSFEPGVAQKDPFNQSSAVKYAHSDHLGTLRAQSDNTGVSASTVCYTAFGERIDAGGYHRYGYAGSWGYQAHDFPDAQSGGPLPFLHVGARYYDPSTGRFLQRDPIGIEGGLNVYSYVDSVPTERIDPSGETWWPNTGRIRYGPSRPIGSVVKRLAFRAGSKVHLFGVSGALAFGGSCVLAAGVGAGVGIAVNYGVPAVTGSEKDRLTDYVVDWIFRKIKGECPGC